ncbi:hypothetical protein TNIN_416851 [Trichonephila inaurata madagascariensis]|uniref:Uncharacterized protein n=1 Tax=Trichonephila inaurata madagascariensis TaxID=2747483 RepID=A0A8X6MI12_9ARAC|nr:hypothetical protein TNIN_416851 [Trichonephila inaurata madagascariensis]
MAKSIINSFHPLPLDSIYSVFSSDYSMPDSVHKGLNELLQHGKKCPFCAEVVEKKGNYEVIFTMRGFVVGRRTQTVELGFVNDVCLLLLEMESNVGGNVG